MSPTRITPTTKTLINVIITKEGDIKIIDSGVIHIGISDHSLVYRRNRPICRKVGIPRSEPKLVETRQFKYFDSTAFQRTRPKNSFSKPL